MLADARNRQAAERHAGGALTGQVKSSGLEIVVIAGPDAGTAAELPHGGKLSLGSSARCDVAVPTAGLAAEHMTIELTSEGVELRVVAKRPLLQHGQIQISAALVQPPFRFFLGDTQIAIRRKADSGGDVQSIFHAEGIVFSSERMLAVARTAQRYAASSAPILLEGETGTGKEVFARAIHNLSLRPFGPFVIVDCGAIPASLIESELFGHERGSFTSAHKQTIGAFERAHGGTLLLDEIGELPLSQQTVLLGVLQRQSFRRIGGERQISVDVRVIAATNRDLASSVEAGSFRRDLYHRITTLALRLPPLRERPEDVPTLVEHHVSSLMGNQGAAELGLDASEIAGLAKRPWLGNVRELFAHVHRRVVAGDLAEPRAAQEEPQQSIDFTNGSYGDVRSLAVARFERAYLLDLMTRANGNGSEAARLARMDRPHLLRLLRKHQLR